MPPIGQTLQEKVLVNQWFSSLCPEEKKITAELFFTTSGPQKDVPENFYQGRIFCIKIVKFRK